LVAKVKDGDSIAVTHGGIVEELRLQGIDAPEGDRHPETRRGGFTAWLALNQRVTVLGGPKIPEGLAVSARRERRAALPGGQRISLERRRRGTPVAVFSDVRPREA
jgi:hypothetical protein